MLQSIIFSYTQQDLAGVEANLGDSRWVVFKTQWGRHYKVFMKKMFNYHTLITGWDLVVVRELLQEEENVRFEHLDTCCFNMLSPHPHPEMSINGTHSSEFHTHYSEFQLGNVPPFLCICETPIFSVFVCQTKVGGRSTVMHSQLAITLGMGQH